MNSLPVEIIREILLHLPPSPSTRLTCHLFNAILTPQLFASIPSFMDSKTAMLKLEEGAREARRRNVSSIWSPRCSVPEEIPIPQSFLLAAYIAFHGRQWKPPKEAEWDSDSGICLEDDVESYTRELTVRDVGDMAEESLKAAMFRYALYLSYSHRGEGEAPSLWIFEEKSWAGKE